jgi:hypothetical protein
MIPVAKVAGIFLFKKQLIYEVFIMAGKYR